MLGLAIDYCFKLTILDMPIFGYNVQIVEEGCRSINHQLDDSKNAGRDAIAR